MTRAVTCPGCKQQIGLADPPEAQENIQLRQQLEELKKIPKMASYIPAYNCVNGDCGQIHKNPNYRFRPKGKCRECDQFSKNSSGKCVWCKQDEIEEIDQDELTDRGIDLPGSDG